MSWLALAFEFDFNQQCGGFIVRTGDNPESNRLVFIKFSERAADRADIETFARVVDVDRSSEREDQKYLSRPHLVPSLSGF